MKPEYLHAEVWPEFTDWWNLYDHKCDRKKCEKKWGKLSQSDKEKAMAHTERYVATTFTDGTFPSRRHPSTYLNNENWNDESLIRTANQQSGSLYAGGGLDEKSRLMHEAIARKYAGHNDDYSSSY